jgi:uroporphyrinogen decarboxylase
MAVPTPFLPSRLSPASQDRRLNRAVGALRQPRVDIAAQGDDPQVRTAMQQQRLATQRRGADDGALRQLVDAREVARDQYVACVFARQERRDGQPGRLRRRHVLHAVDGGVDATLQQGFLDLLNEQSLAAGFGEWPILNHVARGPDHHDLDGAGRRERGYAMGQSVAHQAGLGEGERAAAGANSKKSACHLADLTQPGRRR